MSLKKIVWQRLETISLVNFRSRTYLSKFSYAFNFSFLLKELKYLNINKQTILWNIEGIIA